MHDTVVCSVTLVRLCHAHIMSRIHALPHTTEYFQGHLVFRQLSCIPKAASIQCSALRIIITLQMDPLPVYLLVCNASLRYYVCNFFLGENEK